MKKLQFFLMVNIHSTHKCNDRISNRIRQAQKGNAKHKQTFYEWSSKVYFSTYKPRDWFLFNADLKFPSSIIKIPAVVSNSKEKVRHPTQKPVKLLEYLIKTYTNEGDVVLDSFMGSGTTGVACINTGRRFVGMELDEKYFNIAKKRIKEATEKKKAELL